MTIKNRYLLFLIIKTFNHLYDVKIFMKLDFKNIYYKIWIKSGDKWKIVFRIRYNYFEYLIIFFELINVSITF